MNSFGTEGKIAEVRIGSPVPADTIRFIADDREAIEYLRSRTYLLSHRIKSESPWPVILRSRLAVKIQEPIASSCESQLART